MTVQVSDDVIGAAGQTQHLTAELGRKYMIKSNEVITTSEAQDKHLRAFEKGCEEWDAYQTVPFNEDEMVGFEEFVTAFLQVPLETEKDYYEQLRVLRRQFKNTPSKPQMTRAYHRLLDAGLIERHPSFERISTKKAVRSNSGVVVITIVTAPGKFSCPHDCHYCPDEPGQPRSYLSTEPAVARANQNEFDPVRQFYDRAGTLAKQGHTVDKVEIIVLGGTWSSYPADYQEEFCRDMFYAANTFDEVKSRLGERQEKAANVRPRLPILEEQSLNERAEVKIIGLTLETRPDFINPEEVRRLRRYGCTRVQIGIQHTDDDVLKFINRGHNRAAAVKACRLLKVCGFKVDIHLMPDLPSSTPEKDWTMFQEVLHTEDLQADHWKVYPCEVTPFTKIEQWFRDGTYMPYTERDPQLLIDLLARVKAEVHPWIRLNRVIRDIPECSIVAGNSNTNLRQAIFSELVSMGKSCRCIRCREVRDWPETADGLRLRIREYRSSEGTEYFISIEGSDRGLGGGATQRALAGGIKATKKEKKTAKNLACTPEDQAAAQAAVTAAIASGATREERKEAAARALVAAVAARQPVEKAPAVDFDEDNATLYGLLRLRFNDNRGAPGSIFPELDQSALIRELHVYGKLVAARGGEGVKGDRDSRPQHIGIGRTLMGTAELIAAAQGWSRITVIAGVGVRNYYRRLGYELSGAGQYLSKELGPCPACDSGRAPKSFEASFCDAAERVALPRGSSWDARRVALATVGLAAASLTVVALVRRWRSTK
mmetsp:Transcript_10714/g.28481  ORF Transcript_10714/g.28481 Transcript_10714/m.28481 type:complete len:770 (+) Transcript_10714:83-2392(+)